MGIRKYERKIIKHRARQKGVKESAYVHAVYKDRRDAKKELKRAARETAKQKVEA